jgi:hypothetical protein
MAVEGGAIHRARDAYGWKGLHLVVTDIRNWNGDAPTDKVLRKYGV